MNNVEMQYKTIVKTALITMIAMAILLYMPSPFVVIKPGLAVSSHSFITVIESSENNSSNETQQSIADGQEGSFLLTAVLMEAPNIWNSLLSIFQPNRTVMWKAEALGGASVSQYVKRATTMMQGSYDYALEAAYNYLNIAYDNEPRQLYVNEGGVAGDQLQSGDRIDGIYNDESIVPVKSIEDIAVWLTSHQDAASIELHIERIAESLRVSIALDHSKEQTWTDISIAEQFGIAGFSELRNIVPKEDKYSIVFEDGSIGGPSAGLVLTLTIIDQLTDGDLTKGHTIAVTGTIDAQGRVGAIGGIKQKVYSTAEQGAEIFIVPYGNKEEASKKVRKLGSEMEIIPVSTLEEAMEVIASIDE